MIEKPDFIYLGAKVIALGKKGTITKCPTNEIKGKVYVYTCDVRIDGVKFSTPFHPSDLKPII